ncbi:hypothetical protein PoB_002611500 [Plakobranchus ocellatus]|uniref:Uncharacterized protein n=1 Tax=Plakobranchus ocellatus TaxID=259542 RepID=A0AAV3ZY67_9GAST|nr:hypothetical protein PoB_002611500 [Plakobranchus ocellatus]
MLQQGDLRLLGLLSGQGVRSGARTRDRRVPADLRADSLTTVSPTPPNVVRGNAPVSEFDNEKRFRERQMFCVSLHHSPLSKSKLIHGILQQMRLTN